MAEIPLLSREIEYSLSIEMAPGKRGRPHEDSIITQMLARLRGEYGATFWGIDPRFFGVEPHDTVLTRGMFHGLLGNLHREAVNPYWEVSHRLCDDPFELMREIRRCEQLTGELVRQEANENYTVRCFNAVSDRKGYDAKSAGMHDNFLISRNLRERLFFSVGVLEKTNVEKFSRWLQDLISMRVISSTIFGGEGKVGYDSTSSPACYQISGRSDFVHYLAGGDTTTVRPIINLRDEAHANCVHFSRLHVINSEGNRSPWSIILNTGTMAIFLAALDDDEVRLDWYLANPMSALHNLSRDLTLSRDIEVVLRKNGEKVTRKPTELLLDLMRQSELYCAKARVPSWCDEVVGEAKRLADLLARGDPEDEASSMLDWKIKQWYFPILMQKFNLDPDTEASWSHPEITAADINYHRIEDEKVWRTIIKYHYVKDIDKYYEPYGAPGDDSFLTDGVPGENRSYLLWYLWQNPHLRANTTFLDWGKIRIEGRVIQLEDPRKFGRKHLSLLLEGKPWDFSRLEDRSDFASLLAEQATMRYSGRKEIIQIHDAPYFCESCRGAMGRYNEEFERSRGTVIETPKENKERPKACALCLSGVAHNHAKLRYDITLGYDAPDEDFIRLAGWQNPPDPLEPEDS